MPLRRRVVILFLIACSVSLLGYSGFRAYSLSFTHDESLSYDILTGNLFWKSTANHHPLNTKLMGVTSRWLGSREWELRLPNVLAHALYLGFGLVVLASARNVLSMLVGFVVLNLNPFLLDFFGLARGYGLASGLSMAALFFLYEASRRPELQRVAVLLLLSLTCSSLADLSNFTWLNLHLEVFAAGMLALLLDRERFALRLDRARLAVAAVLSLANFWFVYRLVLRIWKLKTGGELYGRGESGFFIDTLGSMVNSYFYTQSYSESIQQGVRLLLVAGFVIAIAVISY